MELEIKLMMAKGFIVMFNEMYMNPGAELDMAVGVTVGSAAEEVRESFK